MSTFLNIGCGPYYMPGWVNTDIVTPTEGPEPDDYVDIFNLPHRYEPRFTKAYLGHVLEHLPWDRIEDAVSCVAAVMQPGGVIMAVGPCILRAADTRQPDWLLRSILADPRQEPTPGSHKWTPTEELTVAALQAGGLLNVRAVDVATVHRPEWPNRVTDPWQCAVEGIVP